MGKNPASDKKQRSGAGRSQRKNTVKKNKPTHGKKPVREILFPTEPSTIGDEKIYEAVRLVIAERRKQ
jgi:hypothetical protein